MSQAVSIAHLLFFLTWNPLEFILGRTGLINHLKDCPDRIYIQYLRRLLKSIAKIHESKSQFT